MITLQHFPLYRTVNVYIMIIILRIACIHNDYNTPHVYIMIIILRRSCYSSNIDGKRPHLDTSMTSHTIYHTDKLNAQPRPGAPNTHRNLSLSPLSKHSSTINHHEALFAWLRYFNILAYWSARSSKSFYCVP